MRNEFHFNDMFFVESFHFEKQNHTFCHISEIVMSSQNILYLKLIN